VDLIKNLNCNSRRRRNAYLAGYDFLDSVQACLLMESVSCNVAVYRISLLAGLNVDDRIGSRYIRLIGRTVQYFNVKVEWQQIQ